MNRIALPLRSLIGLYAQPAAIRPGRVKKPLIEATDQKTVHSPSAIISKHFYFLDWIRRLVDGPGDPSALARFLPLTSDPAPTPTPVITP
jgi:hypothetical protein